MSAIPPKVSDSPIVQGVGSTLRAAGKTGDAISNNPISKVLKFGISATLGPSLFALIGSLAFVGRCALEGGKSLHTRFVRSTTTNATVKKVELGWENRVESYNNFCSSALKSCMFAWHDTAEYVRESWAERQDEAGYGNTSDNLDSYEARATKAGPETLKKLEVERLLRADTQVFDQKSPSAEITPKHHSTLQSWFGRGHGGGI